LLLKGGHVIGPRNGIDAVRDVGIRDGRIAAVRENLPSSSAIHVVPNSGPARKPAIVFADGKGKSFAAAEAEQLAAKGSVAVWLKIKRPLPSGRVSRYTDLSVGPYLTVVKRHGVEL
jgi:hypothetical protein